MALSMAAMMLPTAAPFLFCYARDSRRPAAVAITLLVYVGAWAAAGTIADLAMNQVMMPSSAMAITVAIAFAVLYTISPWSGGARARCREMCMRAPRGEGMRSALIDGATYTANCLVCSAGVMVALVVLGMSNVLLLVSGAAMLLVMKVTVWPAAVSTKR